MTNCILEFPKRCLTICHMALLLLAAAAGASDWPPATYVKVSPRDPRNDWRAELEDGKAPEQLAGLELDLSVPLKRRKTGAVGAYSPWTDTWTKLGCKDGVVVLPPFQRSLVLKIQWFH